jgi:glucose/arabinose dehydrogenase
MAQAASPTAPGAPGTSAQYVASTVASGFSQPFGIAVNATGQLYVADSGNDRIVRMNTNGSNPTTVATLGAMSAAYGVAVDSAGNVLWTDSGPDGQQVTIMAGDGANPTLIGPTDSPLSVAVDSSGTVYSNLYHSITGMTEEGTGSAPIITGLSAVYNIAVDDSGHLYIPEWPSDEIIKVNTNGTDPTEIVDAPGLGQAAGIAVDDRGHLFVTEQGPGQVVELNDDGSDYHTIATGLSGPFGIAVDGAGNVFVAERDSGVVEELSATNPVPQYGSANLTWSAPASNGGAAIHYYTVVATPTAGGPVISSRFAGAATSGTIYGLKNGTSYALSISATNAVGTGPSASYSATVTTGVPDQMVAPRAAPGNGLVTLSWQPPYNGNEPLDGYVVAVNPMGKPSFTETFSPAATSGVIRGLTNRTTYTFAIKAEADNGEGAWSPSSAGVVPAQVPSAPTGVAATAANKAAVVHWRAPSNDGGAVITRYVVSTVGGTQTCTTTGARSCTVRGLTNGTHYRFRVEAFNDIGPSRPSAASNAVVPKG